MNRQEDKLTPLLAEKDALSVYFEAMLREDTLELNTTVVNIPEAAVITAPIVQPTHVEGKPAWGEKTFQALLFKVSGLTLAVPLVELSGVQEWDREKITPMPGHVDWYLGLMQYRERNVPVVDTAQLVMPEERRLHVLPWQERLRHVVFINNGTWGLACDELAEVVTLQPDAVRWRTSAPSDAGLQGR